MVRLVTGDQCKRARFDGFGRVLGGSPISEGSFAWKGECFGFLQVAGSSINELECRNMSFLKQKSEEALRTCALSLVSRFLLWI